METRRARLGRQRPIPDASQHGLPIIRQCQPPNFPRMTHLSRAVAQGRSIFVSSLAPLAPSLGSFVARSPRRRLACRVVDCDGRMARDFLSVHRFFARRETEPSNGQTAARHFPVTLEIERNWLRWWAVAEDGAPSGRRSRDRRRWGGPLYAKAAASHPASVSDRARYRAFS